MDFWGDNYKNSGVCGLIITVWMCPLVDYKERRNCPAFYQYVLPFNKYLFKKGRERK